MAATASQIASSFWFGDVLHLRKSKTICIPNFDKISPSTAEILLLPVSGNKRRHIEIPLRVSTLTFSRHRRHAILHLPAELIQIGSSGTEL